MLLQLTQLSGQCMHVKFVDDPYPVLQPPCTHFPTPSLVQPAGPQLGSQAPQVYDVVLRANPGLQRVSHFPSPFTIQLLLQFISHVGFLHTPVALSSMKPTSHRVQAVAFLLQFRQPVEHFWQVKSAADPYPAIHSPRSHFMPPAFEQPADPQWASHFSHVCVSFTNPVPLSQVLSHFPGPNRIHEPVQFW